MKGNNERTIRSTVVLTEEQNRILKEMAYQDERSLGYVLKKCVEYYIANEDKRSA